MIRFGLFSHLIQKEIIFNNEIQYNNEEQKVTFTDNSDYDQDLSVVGEIQSRYLVTLVISSNINKIVPLKSFQYVKTVEIASTRITSIPPFTFKDCRRLTKVLLPSSITTIGDLSFYNSSISEIDLSHVTSIGLYSFYFCNNLITIDISSVSTLNNYCFSFSGLTSLTFPGTFRVIPYYAFYKCSNLTTVTLGSSITQIYDFAFSFTKISSISLPQTIENIGKSFSHTMITELSIPQYCDSIYILSPIESLQKLTVLDAATKVTCINQPNLETVELPTGFNPEKFFFTNYQKLKTISNTNSIEKIVYRCFYNCRSLKNFDASSCSYFGAECFKFCENLETIQFSEETTELNNNNNKCDFFLN